MTSRHCSHSTAAESGYSKYLLSGASTGLRNEVNI